jgi:hypothetical protein
MTGSELVKWNMPDGTPVVFQDVRPGAKTAPEPEPLIVPSSREVAGHEARHAAAALLLGFPVIEARADWPDPFGAKAHVVGYIRYDAGSVDWNTPATQRKSAVVTLVGDMSTNRNPKAAGFTGKWPPAWPPTDKLGADSDEARLAEYAKSAALDEAGWDELCDEARRLARMDEFKQLTSVFEALLEHGTVLDARMLKAAFNTVIQRSLVQIRSQVTQLKADIDRFSRELDDIERFRDEFRDQILDYMRTDQDTRTTTPAHVVVEVRTSP